MMKDIDSLSAWSDESIVETKELQIYSLKQLMNALGYSYKRANLFNGSDHFFSDQFQNKGRERVSISTAVRLYNSKGSAKNIFGKPNPLIGVWSFNDYSLTKANAARITTKVKLQWCKKTRSIICQDHRVKFVSESYTKLFLDNKYLNV